MAVLNDLIVTGSARIIGPISGTFPAGEVLVGNGTGAIMTKPILTEFSSSSSLITAEAINNYFIPRSGGTVGKWGCKLTNSTQGDNTATILVLEKDINKPAAGAILPLVSARYQNQAGDWYGGDIISAIGTTETGKPYNAIIKFGSYNGTTFITAGESGTLLPPLIVPQMTTSGAESLYLVSDETMYFYVGDSKNLTTSTAAANLKMSISTGEIEAIVRIKGTISANDYAEYRKTNEEIEPGRVVIENGDDSLSLAVERLMPGANIVSDTFGFSVGGTDNAQSPIAVSGRVLAYTYEDRNTFKAGDPVCSGPNGTVSKMTREEVKEYPDRMIGTVSAIPEYETWGSNNVKVNGRIWIKVL